MKKVSGLEGRPCGGVQSLFFEFRSVLWERMFEIDCILCGAEQGTNCGNE
jgi:hypothetical protein